MSTIRVNNFGPSAGGTTYSARGIAKAWINFNGTGTIAVRDSENMSSITDNGTGDYTQNVTSSFANANYSTVFGSGNTSNLGKVVGVNTSGGYNGSLLTYNSTSVRLGDTRDDHTYIGTTCHGDLA